MATKQVTPSRPASDGGRAAPDLLEFEDVSKSYGDVVALDRCSFTVRSGRLTGFLGPNGAGKTTAMRALFGLVLTDGGEIRWNGHQVDHSARGRFGYMPEERGLYPTMRILEQVTHFGFVAGMSRADARRSADGWLERLGLSDRRDATLEELSHGNQQRIQLAVALVHDPELLVLDEPFAGLDPLGVDELGGLLQSLAADGRTVLFSSHQLDLVEGLCDDVVTIDRGRIVLAGDLDELKAASTRRYLRLEVAGGSLDLLADLPGVHVLDQRDGIMEVAADRAIELGPLIETAEGLGELLRLEYRPPSLSQLFREAVQR